MESNVKQRIKDLLSQKGITVSALSEAIGIPQSTLSRQINSDTSLSISAILSILEYFEDLSPEWLIKGEGEMIRQNIHQTNNQGDNINAGGNLSLDKSVKTNIDPKYVEKLEEDNKRMNQEISKLKDDLLKLQQSMIDLLSKKK
ncbi:MAG: helix-turn-helix domain-containing protein [Odoribacter sp.]|nr:helix-turn-helix domain-containing protein [Odoribacter sp.]